MKTSETAHRLIYSIAHRIAPLLVRSYNFKTTPVPDPGEPYIVLANHTTERDMVMLATAFRKHMYFVCGEHLFRTSFGKALRLLFDPIPAPRGGSMVKATMEILRRCKRGHNIMMFPEGCRSFHGETLPQSPVIGKLVKKSGHALITYRTRGGYFIAPRWAYEFRPGQAEGAVVNVYSSADLAKMSAQEVTDAINRDIFENAYDSQTATPYPYRAKRLAEGLENYLVICPKCGSYDTMQTRDDRFHCTCCGLGGVYDEYGFLNGDELPFRRVDEWGKWMEDRYARNLSEKAPDALLFTEQDIQLYDVTSDHRRIDREKGELRIYRDRLEFGGDTFDFENISALSLLYYGKTVLFTHKGRYVGMTGEAFHAWKIEQLYLLHSQLARLPAP